MILGLSPIYQLILIAYLMMDLSSFIGWLRISSRVPFMTFDFEEIGSMCRHVSVHQVSSPKVSSPVSMSMPLIRDRMGLNTTKRKSLYQSIVDSFCQ